MQHSTKVYPETLVVLKCLKPVSERKIRRELLVLGHASKLPNLARLLALVIPEQAHDEVGKDKPSVPTPCSMESRNSEET